MYHNKYQHKMFTNHSTPYPQLRVRKHTEEKLYTISHGGCGCHKYPIIAENKHKHDNECEGNPNHIHVYPGLNTIRLALWIVSRIYAKDSVQR
ncbi:T. brucei spp.-specific protein [Trypanosoma brucei gambiense DAL972]|uniref:T. brucei spp.-specific protein n=1 Tax=Trypanosoma brucei gambiense (strain MHOM/CI/86/DAL972) TaxID=679716 RepID=C9ZIE1_TRYB9|nr:T. brucei spp.-specific protein [Trypanosoma brucei gambiense DAL972]CBH08933.1 T. brucei spp.-specific protein [Trypanosoma brucei gambiense DAL972]|eukprot:XP_011771374.1 T. brucei spp.-specific protein [Trypanosoma brucei gambiense DAL972]